MSLGILVYVGEEEWRAEEQPSSPVVSDGQLAASLSAADHDQLLATVVCSRAKASFISLIALTGPEAVQRRHASAASLESKALVHEWMPEATKSGCLAYLPQANLSIAQRAFHHAPSTDVY